MTVDGVGFDEFMETALYGAGGFYSSGSGPGRRGASFLTSPEMGPLFGAVIADALDVWWDALGSPSPFPVLEAGGGRGTLAAAILAAEPRCAEALHYVVIERAAPARAEAAAIVDARAELPEPGSLGPVGVVLANELLDNLAFKVVERAHDGWRELRVLATGDQHAFVLGGRVSRFDHVDAEVGARIPWHTAAIQWLAQARAIFERSHITLVDYGTSSTAELARRPWRDWLRTYLDHGRGLDPLHDPGSQDITTDIAFDQLSPHTVNTQADWLRAHGIEDLVQTARATWHERAAIGDLAALKARSRVNEADALLDPNGPGGFLVAEWVP